MKKLTILALPLVALAILLLTCKSKECDKVALMKQTIDSLNSEIFTKNIDIQRYEYILDEADSTLDNNCREKLHDIISNTE